jgi:hypothetical protein
LAELVKFHYEDQVDENEDRLEADQVTMIRGILHMSDKTVSVSLMNTAEVQTTVELNEILMVWGLGLCLL